MNAFLRLLSHSVDRLGCLEEPPRVVEVLEHLLGGHHEAHLDPPAEHNAFGMLINDGHGRVQVEELGGGVVRSSIGRGKDVDTADLPEPPARSCDGNETMKTYDKNLVREETDTEPGSPLMKIRRESEEVPM